MLKSVYKNFALDSKTYALDNVYIRYWIRKEAMDEYKKPYLTLWNAVTDALEQLNRQDYRCAEETLLKAQQDAEEIYISNEA